jgi:hypothetical protein
MALMVGFDKLMAFSIQDRFAAHILADHSGKIAIGVTNRS